MHVIVEGAYLELSCMQHAIVYAELAGVLAVLLRRRQQGNGFHTLHQRAFAG